MKKASSILTKTSFGVLALLLTPMNVFAEISNPVISPVLGSGANKAYQGTTFSSYFITIWRALITIGGLTLIFNLVNGALEWISAGGAKDKVEHGRQKMTNAVIGMVILSASFAFVSFISSLFGFNLLQLTIPTPQ